MKTRSNVRKSAILESYFKCLKKIITKLETLTLLLLLFLVPLHAKDRQWQTGKLLDSSVQHFAIHTRRTYAIDDGTSIYTVSSVTSSRWSKGAKVTVKAPVKFSIENDSCYLLDDDGQQYELKLVKKTRKSGK